MSNKVLLCICTFVCSFLMLNSDANAAKIDPYKEILNQKQFTVKYDIEPINIAAEKQEVYIEKGKTYLVIPFNPATIFKEKSLKEWDIEERKDFPIGGIIIRNEENEYSEVKLKDRNVTYDYSTAYANMPDYAPKSSQIKYYRKESLSNVSRYFLKKNNEKFHFYGASTNGRKKKYGITKDYFDNRIAPNISLNGSAVSDMLEENYGTPVIGRILFAINPNNSAYVYKFVNSGTSDSGEFYEDYLFEDNKVFSAVRFFFNSETLAKASNVYYEKNTDGKAKDDTYMTYNILFKEFSNIPDNKYFELPKEIKIQKVDKEKYDKKMEVPSDIGKLGGN